MILQDEDYDEYQKIREKYGENFETKMLPIDMQEPKYKLFEPPYDAEADQAEVAHYELTNGRMDDSEVIPEWIMQGAGMKKVRGPKHKIQNAKKIKKPTKPAEVIRPEAVDVQLLNNSNRQSDRSKDRNEEIVNLDEIELEMEDIKRTPPHETHNTKALISPQTIQNQNKNTNQVQEDDIDISHDNQPHRQINASASFEDFDEITEECVTNLNVPIKQQPSVLMNRSPEKQISNDLKSIDSIQQFEGGEFIDYPVYNLK